VSQTMYLRITFYLLGMTNDFNHTSWEKITPSYSSPWALLSIICKCIDELETESNNWIFWIKSINKSKWCKLSLIMPKYYPPSFKPMYEEGNHFYTRHPYYLIFGLNGSSWGRKSNCDIYIQEPIVTSRF
jgi:hypothetical protein